MKPANELIKAFDNELLRTKKRSITLNHANDMLVSEGLMSMKEWSKGGVRILLEEGQIPHAYKRTRFPKKWRIPLSEQGLNKMVAEKHKKQKKQAQIIEKKVPSSTILIISFTILIVIVGIVQYRDYTIKPTRNRGEWQDPGMYESGSSEWPYYGRTTKELLNDLRNAFEGKGVTPNSEQALYDKIGGKHPGSQKGPQYYSYDFLEVPISMTLIVQEGQRYYLMFERGGVKKGDPRLDLPK